MSVAPLRLAVLISGGGTTLQNLTEQIRAGLLPAEIASVIVSNTHAAGIERAKNLKLPVQIIARREYAGTEPFSDALTAEIRRHHVHVVCLAGFLSLWQIPADFAAAPESAGMLHPALSTGLPRVMNIHPALLPDFGGKGMHGRHVHEAVLAAGRNESGCTVHFCDNLYDNGPIIVQRRCPVLTSDTPDSLAARVSIEEKKAYPEALRLYAQGYLRLTDRHAVVPKVLAYITRRRAGRLEMIVFNRADDPSAGTRIPAGTMEAHEPADVAVLRQAVEKTGLQGLRLVRKIGVYPYECRRSGVRHQRHVYQLTTDEPTPETWDHDEESCSDLTNPAAPSGRIRFRLRWQQLPLNIPLAAAQDQYLSALL